MNPRGLLRLAARILSLLALVLVASIIIWSLTWGDLDKQLLSDLRSVNDLTPSGPSVTEVAGGSTPTVEPEDFISLGFFVLLTVAGVAGVVAAWRSRPWGVLASAILMLGLAALSLWSIGLFIAPAGLLLLLAAGALFVSGEWRAVIRDS